MKTIYFALVAFTLTSCVSGQIADPVTHFKSLGSGAKPLMKWQADINGDGKCEIFLSLKEEYDQDVASDQPPGWFLYIADGTGTNFTQSTGIKEQGESSIGTTAPIIDLKVCFVGHVAELGKHAIITEQIDNPRVGKPVARIFAYTIEGNHLKRTKLAEYDATQENELFDKYLKDGKRTVITPVEVTQ